MGSSSQTRQAGPDKEVTVDPRRGGERVDPGPYVATVIGYKEGSRMGELIVSIPDWSGYVDPTELGVSADGITVSYASPFYGTTYGTDTEQLPDTPATSGQSYGMWMVPPDLGNKVLVTFANGQRDRGYWFACVYDSQSHHMVPGLARSIGGNDKTSNPADSLTQYVHGDSVLPVVEYSTSESTAFEADSLENSMRYPHEVQTMALVKQGLDRDPIRGAISSSSMREAPSNVYGISTPGRKATVSDQDPNQPQSVVFRKGGHTFVMDDGDKNGNDQLIRLRTTGGHQLLMNDTEHVLYIGSDTGNQWLEFSADGSINVFATTGLNMRSKGPMNFHSDTTINMNAESININGEIGIKMTSLASITVGAVGMVSVTAGGALKLSAAGIASLNAGGAVDVTAAGPLNLFGDPLMLNCLAKPPGLTPPAFSVPSSASDTTWNGTGWQKGASLHSICKVVPAHEPWDRPAPKT